MFATKCLVTLAMALSAFMAEETPGDPIKAVSKQIENLKPFHVTEIIQLRTDIKAMKKTVADHTAQNEQAHSDLEWAKASMIELRAEMKDLTGAVRNSVLIRELHIIQNKLNLALLENVGMAQAARAQETRIDKLDEELKHLKYEGQLARSNHAEMRKELGGIHNEIKAAQLAQLNSENEVPDVREKQHGGGGVRLRHGRTAHAHAAQIARLAQSQEQLDNYQHNLQAQILDVQRRLDRLGDSNWYLVSAKVEYLELEGKNLREHLQNTSQQISDFDKVHASLLELREDMESIENKADKTIPEFRKEISKLDVSFAQLTAHVSYLKEDQENLRKSVKAIAVSVSNTIDQAELDRLAVSRINSTVEELQSHSRQHSHRLNDHIMKSEANQPADSNDTQIVPLSELMGEVKELEPVQREYEDLVNQLPIDCSTVDGPPGPYLIHPTAQPVDTWCRNGTTLIQRRYNGSEDFNRSFRAYTDTFGHPSAEYWIGLDPLHALTKNNCTSMRIDMKDIFGGQWYAEYEYFNVGSADTGYVLEVGGFKGNASDSFEYQNHMEFSAIDRDRDISNTHCAANYEGGWWYSHCQHVNINGRYNLGLTWFDSKRNDWIAVETSEMVLYLRPGCA